MRGVKHTKATAVDIALTGEGELTGISAAGTGSRKEPKYVALQVVIDKMNDLFGAEAFAESQAREFVQGLVQKLLANPEWMAMRAGSAATRVEASHAVAISQPRAVAQVVHTAARAIG